MNNGVNGELLAGLDLNVRVFDVDDLALRLGRGDRNLKSLLFNFAVSGPFLEHAGVLGSLGNLGNHDRCLVVPDVELEVGAVACSLEPIAGALFRHVGDRSSISVGDNRS